GINFIVVDLIARVINVVITAEVGKVITALAGTGNKVVVDEVLVPNGARVPANVAALAVVVDHIVDVLQVALALGIPRVVVRPEVAGECDVTRAVDDASSPLAIDGLFDQAVLNGDVRRLRFAGVFGDADAVVTRPADADMIEDDV